MLLRRIWGFLGLVTVAGLLPAACGGDDVTVREEAVGTGELGESCSSPTQCAEGLSCVSNVCVESGTEPGVQLGEEGESCQARADCQQGLACIANVCTDASADPGGSQVGPGKRGESCQTRSDCEAGLTCIGGTCVIDEFGLEPTGKICSYVACREAADCLLPAETCESYQASCEADAVSFACDYYRTNCTAENWSCSGAGACVYEGTCTNWVSSSTYGCPTTVNQSVCNEADDVCVQCLDSVDCPLGQECVSDECIVVCQTKEDCGFFQDCNADSQQCEEVGCQTDRECVAFTGNALSTCNLDTGECVEPCDTDAECDDAFAYSFRACIEGSCQNVGCETDEECRIRSASTATKAVCTEAP